MDLKEERALVYIYKWGGYEPYYGKEGFKNCYGLVHISAMDAPDLIGVTNLS